MVQAKYHHQEEDLKECEENFRLGKWEKHECYKGRNSTIEDRWTNFYQSLFHSFIPWAIFDHEAMGDMGRVVHAESNRNGDENGKGGVDGKAPEASEASNIYNGEEYGEENN